MKTVLLLLFAVLLPAQIATLPVDATDASLSARGGRHFAASAKLETRDGLGLFARSSAGLYDFGAAYRAVRVQTGGTFLDAGLTAMYGSQGLQGAVQGGVLFGDSADCFFWGKVALGNYQEVRGGAQLGRLGVSGAYGSSFENPIELTVRLDRRGRFAAVAGWSNTLGPNLGLKMNRIR